MTNTLQAVSPIYRQIDLTSVDIYMVDMLQFSGSGGFTLRFPSLDQQRKL